jgi:predicted nuclease with TOPRIM domain
MRNLYLKQEENNESFKAVAEKLEALTVTEAEKPAALAELKEIISKSDEFTHRECVKVYRNVQALLDEQNKKLDESVDKLKKQMETSQAADPAEDLAYIKRVLNHTLSSAKGNRVWLVIVALLSAANLACVLLIHFGLL